MTIDELLSAIATAGKASATVTKLALGNPGGVGDQRVITVSVGADSLRFIETEAGWQLSR